MSQVRILPSAQGFPGDLNERAGSHDNLVTTARSLLVAVADGAPDAREKARQLALADIESRGGELALQVLSDDVFSLVRAVELARMALDGAKDAGAELVREASHE
jgi:hypothetical protein